MEQIVNQTETRKPARQVHGLAMVLLLLPLILAGCADSTLSEWDDTCFNCQTVCSGASGEEMDLCLTNCVYCQGSSSCFAAMEGQYEGMALSMSDWLLVDCDLLDERIY